MAELFPPKKFREMVVQLLYALDLSGQFDQEMDQMVMGELKVSQSVVREAELLVHLIWQRQEEIDLQIGRFAEGYVLKRIGCVPRAILRYAAYDLLFVKSPPALVIAESVRLATKFGTAESGAFVHGVLDAMGRENATLSS